MLNTLAYYFGFSGKDVTAADTNAPSFVTKEAEDQWTLVDLNATKPDGKSFYHIFILFLHDHLS